MRIDTKIKLFFCVFGTVYFLESIGGFYMTSAVVYIEKQFQIPSKMSGTMVSAGDFAYIPVVVFTSYFGGKGNRAKWIGAGCMLIAIANWMVSSSNFLFPVEKFELNTSYIDPHLAYEINRFVHHKEKYTADWLKETILRIDRTNPAIASYDGQHENIDLFVHLQIFCEKEENEEMCTIIADEIEKFHASDEDDVRSVTSLTSLPYSVCNTKINLLRKNHKQEECQKEHSSMGPFLMIFCGLLILGVGRTMPFSLGLPLMDDNVKKQNLPIFFAMMFFMRIVGPIVGLIVGSFTNRIYYNFKPPQGLTPKDPMWIGCWWLGFLIFGTVLFFPSLGLYGFKEDDIDEIEKEIEENGTKKPKKRLNLVDRHVRKSSDGRAYMPEATSDKILEFVVTMKVLFKNPIYVGSMLGRIVDVLAFKGFFVFLGKYLELQYGVPQYKIQLYLASTGVVGFAIGVAFGAGAMKIWKLQGRKAAAWVGVASLMAAVISFANTTTGCKSMIGHLGDEIIANNGTVAFDECRADCKCDGMPFYPVCNQKGEVFYSPCHAGCPLGGATFDFLNNTGKDKDIVFSRCACAGTDDLTVSKEFCEVEHCETQFNRYFFFQAIGAVFGGMAVVPGMLIILRAVPPEHRSIALGFNGFLVSLLATLPSPMFWGAIFDMSCVAWQSLCGNKEGACAIYDTDQLRLRLHIIYGSLRIISLASDIWVFYWAKGLKIVDEVDEPAKPEESTEMEVLPEKRALLTPDHLNGADAKKSHL